MYSSELEKSNELINGKIPLTLESGETLVGVESTVIRVMGDKIWLLRQGRVSAEELQAKIGCEVIDKTKLSKDEKPESPGMKYTHYAPKCKMMLVLQDTNNMPKKLKDIYEKLVQEKYHPVILCSNENAEKLAGVECMPLGNNSNEACSLLFSYLRKAEKKYDYIICENIENGTMSEAFFNRASKSCGGNIE